MAAATNTGTSTHVGGRARSKARSRATMVVAGIFLLITTVLASLQQVYPDAHGYAQRGPVDTLLYPLEINPTLRLTRVGGHLFGIAFAADGKSGVAVGEGGLILATDNGGLDWRRARRGGGTTLHDVAMSADGATAVAVGDNDAVLVRRPAQPAWTVAGAPPGEYYATAISADGIRMIAVGAGGAISISSDGGASWAAAGAVGGRDFRAVALSNDGMTGWLGGDDGILYATKDGGLSWSRGGMTTGTTGAAADRAGYGMAKAIAYDVHQANNPNSAFVPAVYTPASNRPPFQRIAFVPAEKAEQRPPSDSLSKSPPPDPSKDSAAQLYEPPQQTMQAQLERSAKPAPNPRPSAAAKSASRRPAVMPINPAPAPSAPLPRRDPITALSPLPASPGIAGIAGGALFVGTPENSVSGPGSLSALAMTDATSGWAAGPGGAISGTTSGGAEWQQQTISTHGAIEDIAALADRKHAWAAGAGTILATSDGGTSWYPQLRAGPAQPGAVYRRLPAPWFYPAFGLAVALMVSAFRPAPPESKEGVAAIGVTDAPAASVVDDKLQFTALARGISRFLRNEATRPPLTLAVSGDWGTGKSSLMQMMCEDLRLHGNRPVWFNAWHHQDEEQLLAALLAAIRDKALPPFLTPQGLSFRTRLFWMRAVKWWRLSLLLLFLTCALLAFFMLNGAQGWAQIGELIGGLFKDGGGNTDKEAAARSLWVVPQVGSALAIFAGVRRALKSFGTDPAVLLTKSVENFKLSDASAQVSFRTRFQSQFDEVTTALPYPLVIVIDDLDRCRPDTVLQVMESVNFLMSSGECFVVFGMATHRVQAALALSFKDIAQELVELDAVISPDGPPHERDRAEREKRRKYAGEYLQKLINLEIKVPSRADIPPHLLLMQSERDDEDDDWLAAGGQWVRRYVAPLAVAAGVAAAGWALSAQYFRLAPPVRAVAAQPSAVARSGEGAAGPASMSTPVKSAAAAAAAAQPARREVKVEPGRDGSEGRLWPLYLLCAALAAIAVVIRYRLRHRNEVVRDSSAFAEALKAWTPVVARKTPSPRAIKRFGNRLRYLAMLQQAEGAGPGGYAGPMAWVRRLSRLVARTDGQQSAATIDVVAEHRIVALGAIQMLHADDWRQRIENGFGQANGETDDDGDLLQGAVRAYAAMTGAGWPPSAAELNAFEHSINGIRIEGEVSILAATSSGGSAPSTPRRTKRPSRAPRQSPPEAESLPA